jgi:hypothetical protein
MPIFSARCVFQRPLICLVSWGIWSLTVLVSEALNPALLVPSDVGITRNPGSTTNIDGVVTLKAGGQGISFSADQFHFAAAMPSPATGFTQG